MRLSLLFFLCAFSLLEGASAALHYKRCAVLGNSITIHPVTNYWWGRWGMAASDRPYDWVHVFQAKLVADGNASASVHACNISAWERDYATDDLSCLDTCLTGSEDLVIIRLGENATFSEDYLSAFTALIDSVQKHCREARILITGNFWPDDDKDWVQREVATAKGCLWVELQNLYNETNCPKITDRVMGDDGRSHLICSNSIGVAKSIANHPNDAGMQAIADAIYETLSADPTAVASLRPDVVPADTAFYDLQGRRVRRPLPKSIYIRGGSKVVVK